MLQTVRLADATRLEARFDASGNAAAVLSEEARDGLRQRHAPRGLLCYRCRSAVSNDAERIEVGGAHAHTCVNPHGIVYRIGCFGSAPGCSAVGGLSIAYSWFPDYGWQVAVCRHCEEHLGWRFRGDGLFFGLILERLLSAGD